MFESETYKIPEEIVLVAKTLQGRGFQAFLVGGCTRDLLLGNKPKDWDIATNATPEEIISLFIKTFYENDYGTVGVVNESTTDETLKIVEVTPFRLEAKYSNQRHPDSVNFSDKLEEDLKRRDFTINAIALEIGEKINSGYKCKIIDLYKGQEDLANRVIRTVGKPEERFTEDTLRILRAVRLASELDFKIEGETAKSIEETSAGLEKIASERIRDEFSRIIMSDRPKEGIELCLKLGILQYVMPILLKTVGVTQNKAHSYDVWEHTLRALQHGATKKLALEVRLAVLLHDIAKPQTRRWSEEKKEWTFHGHEVVGVRLATEALATLKFSKKILDKVLKLVRWHMFFSDTEQITLSAVRRIVASVGKENIWDLMDVRACDRIGTGRPKETPYRLRKYKSMIEEAMHDPISVGMLKIDGKKIMEIAKLDPSPKIGHILHALLQEVLENPKLNAVDFLENEAVRLSKIPDKELATIGEEAKTKKDKEEDKQIEQIRKKYWVK